MEDSREPLALLTDYDGALPRRILSPATCRRLDAAVEHGDILFDLASSQYVHPRAIRLGPGRWTLRTVA